MKNNDFSHSFAFVVQNYFILLFEIFKRDTHPIIQQENG